MIPVLCAVLAAILLTHGLSLFLSHRERESQRSEREILTAAMMQFHGAPDAARRMETGRKAELWLKQRDEILANGGVWEPPLPENAKVGPKPEGI